MFELFCDLPTRRYFLSRLRTRHFSYFLTFSTSRLQMFFKMNVQPKGLQLYQKETPTQVFSCKNCEILKNSFFIENLRWLLLNFLSLWKKSEKINELFLRSCVSNRKTDRQSQIHRTLLLKSVFFKHFASTNQLPRFYINGTLVENGLKMIRYTYYFVLINLFFLKIFKFLSWLFGHVEKTA